MNFVDGRMKQTFSGHAELTLEIRNEVTKSRSWNRWWLAILFLENRDSL